MFANPILRRFMVRKRSEVPIEFNDAIVGSGCDYETIQAADDALDGGAYSLYVQSGSYTENVTISTNNARIYFESGTTVSGTITLSGAECTLEFGNGCTVTGLFTITGSDNHILLNNGCSLQAGLSTSTGLDRDWETVVPDKK